MARGAGGVDVDVIGQRLLRLREARGWSMRALAEKAGVSHGYVDRVEKGLGERVSLGHLASIAGALGVSVAELVGPGYAGEAEEEGYAGAYAAEIRAEVMLLPEEGRRFVLQVIRAAREWVEVERPNAGQVRILGSEPAAPGAPAAVIDTAPSEEKLARVGGRKRRQVAAG